jgi:hypothetical protein
VIAYLNWCIVAPCRQRNCQRKVKLSHLFQSVERAGHTSGTGGKPSSGQIEDVMPDTTTMLEKCITMKQLVESLVGKRELLEQGCMGLEDSLALKTDELWRAQQRLRESKSPLKASSSTRLLTPSCHLIHSEWKSSAASRRHALLRVGLRGN